MATLSDESLMGRVQAGGHESMRALFDRHHPAIYGFLVASVRDADLAEDLTQDVFVRVWRHRASFDSTKPFRPWIFRIARNVASDARRRPVSLPLPDSIAALDPPADERLDAAERAGRVRDAVRTLPDGQREVLLLSRWSGMKYRDIADVVGCSEGAVRVRVHRAMETLRTTLDPVREDA
jgi:RNA polymerase sigma-70 factor (ECF subfamily)